MAITITPNTPPRRGENIPFVAGGDPTYIEVPNREVVALGIYYQNDNTSLAASTEFEVFPKPIEQDPFVIDSQLSFGVTGATWYSIYLGKAITPRLLDQSKNPPTAKVNTGSLFKFSAYLLYG